MSARRDLAERVIPVSEPDDPRVAGFSNIRERDLTRREGRFIAEGTVVLRVLAEAARQGTGFAIEAVLVLENRLDGIADIVAGLRDEVPVYCASRAVIDGIAGFPMHRGILALGRRIVSGDEDFLDSLPDNALVLAACGIANHDNIGALFRNAGVFGADAVVIDGTCCDPLYRKAIRVSVGSVFKVPCHRFADTDAMIEALVERGFALSALSPGGRTPLAEIAEMAPRAALLVGTEGEGLPRDLLERLSTVRIEQTDRMDSINVATASGIALHHFALKMGRLGGR